MARFREETDPQKRDLRTCYDSVDSNGTGSIVWLEEKQEVEKTKLKGILFYSLLIGTILISMANATPENAEKAGKDCSYCHPDGPPVLGEAGLYFQEHHTLDGFGEIGVHIDQWNVAIICFSAVLLVVVIVYISRV